MTVGEIFELANVAFSMTGSVFIARRNRIGYKIFIVGFIPAAGFAIAYRHWAMLALYTYYFMINCYGNYLWRKHDGYNN